MKRRFVSAVIAVCIVVFSFILPSSEGLAQNNDTKYDSYVNMLPNDTGHAKYIVPNLYRQDASYINVKTFPLVVNNSVEYFPLDIFALYPYLQVVYSRITHGFYINNTKNNHYVAFDMETGTTTTHDEQMLNIEAKIFNRTYYVPAQKVCEILEMNFETYDDEKNGIRAARISDSRAKMTLPQLVTAYSPVKKEASESVDYPDNPGNDTNSPQTPEDGEQHTSSPNEETTPPENIPPQASQGPDTTKPDELNQVDPYSKLIGKALHLCFDTKNEKITSDVLDVLDKNGATAVFFVNKETILAIPDTVRRIIAEGHGIGISFDISNTDTTSENAAEAVTEQINKANDALYLVAKAKTRYISPSSNYSKLADIGFPELAREYGFELFDKCIIPGNYNASGIESLISDITGQNKRTPKAVAIKFSSGNGTASLVDALIGFTKKYPQFTIAQTDEYAAKTIFSGN